MREIKFRVWVPETATMCEPTTTGGYITGNVLNDFIREKQQTQVWMQYTGLKDKNGREIYEGDLLGSYEGEELGWERHGVVTYQNDRAQFWLMEPPTYEYASESELCSEGDEWKTLEIIGNIYENPELLTV